MSGVKGYGDACNTGFLHFHLRLSAYGYLQFLTFIICCVFITIFILLQSKHNYDHNTSVMLLYIPVGCRPRTLKLSEGDLATSPIVDLVPSVTCRIRVTTYLQATAAISASMMHVPVTFTFTSLFIFIPADASIAANNARATAGMQVGAGMTLTYELVPVSPQMMLVYIEIMH